MVDRRRILLGVGVSVVAGLAVAYGARTLSPSSGFPAWAIGVAASVILLAVAVAAIRVFGATRKGPSGPQPKTAPPSSTTRSDPVSDGPVGRWKLVQGVFLQVLDLPESERDAFIVRATRSDSSLREEVISLLAAHEGAGALDELRDRVVGPIMRRSGSVEELEGGTVLHYEILEKLGTGGMGVVYKARDRRLGRLVTLKFLSPHLLTNLEAKERFLVEARAAASLDHRNLCTIHEVGEMDGGRLFIAMTYYEGDTLKRRIERGRLEIAESLDIGAQLCRGLACASGGGIVHRDIKPSNVMLTVDGIAKILDFGLAKVSGGELTRTGARMGTVAYMSPEQTRGDAVDHRTDIWSVGVVLYEMLSGRRPFRGGSDQAVIHAILNEEATALGTLVPGLPSSIEAVVHRALCKDPALRYPDAESLLNELERLLADPASRSVAATPQTLPADGERRLITVLSCSVEGFETWVDTLEPEAVDQRLAMLRARIQGIVEDYGGVLNHFSDEQFVAIFGAPVTHEDDVLRSVRAALEIRDFRIGDADITLRSAIGTGHVAIRATDSTDRPYRVGGSLARDVARLAARACAGQVLILRDLARVIEPFVETEECAPVTLSDHGDPVTPLAIVARSPVANRLDAPLRRGLTRFVGRTAELDTVTRALESTKAGSGRLVSVIGDAGVGKSRLLHEFRETLAEDGIRYVQGRCQSYGRLTPFLPFIECVRAMLGLGGSQQGQIHDLVVSRLRALDGDFEMYVPVVLHLLSIESERHPLPRYLKGEDLRAAIAECLLSLFTLGSRGRPLVLLLEDWHWADGGSADVMEHLVEMATPYPLLILVTARPEQDGQRPTLRGHIHLDLRPLEPASAVEVIRATLGATRLTAELAHRIGEKTGGNPFFIEELCHTLVEDGTIVVDAGEAGLANTSGRLAIPDTVQAVLKTRLDRLDPEAREVLRSASVIGREFGLELLGRVVPSRARLESALEELRSAALVQRTAVIPEKTYRFKHALTLDVAYGSLLERQRRDRHRLVGDSIERLYPDRLEEFADRLATHFAGAEDWDRAVRYGFQAADRSAAVWRLTEAVGMLERIRPWLAHLEVGKQARRQMLTRLLLEEERHLETLGHRERQQEVIDELLQILPHDRTPEHAAVLVRQGELSTLVGEFERGLEAFQEAIEVATESRAVNERAMALRGLGHRYWRLGQYEDALGPLTEVVEHDRGNASTTMLLRDLVNLGRVRRELGQWEEAQAIGAETQALAALSGNVIDQIYAANYQGHLLKAMGRPEDALRVFKAGIALTTEAHLPIRLTFHLLAQGALQIELGQIEEALTSYDEAVATAQRAGRADNLAHALRLRGEALETVQRTEAAIDSYQEAVAILAALSKDTVLASTLGKLARLYEATQHTAAAATWRSAWEIKKELGDLHGALEAAEREARLRRNDPDMASEAYQAALDITLVLDDAESEARIRNSLALLAWRARRLTDSEHHYRAALARLVEAAAQEGMGVLLNGLGTVLSAQGQHEEAQAVLEEALTENRRTQDMAREADTLSALGAAARARGDATTACGWYERCLDLRREARDRTGAGWALLRLAELSDEAGASGRAATYSEEALLIAREVGDTDLAAECVSSGNGQGLPVD